MDKSLEEKNRMGFRGKLSEEKVCVHVSMCVMESHVLFAVSTSAVCLYYKKE